VFELYLVKEFYQTNVINVFELYLVKEFYQTNVILGNFQSKSKSIHLFVLVFLCILASWESYLTHRQPIGLWQVGGGGSHRESSLLPIGCLGVIYDSQLHGYALFIVIMIRINLGRDSFCHHTGTSKECSPALQ
jgi:hypothetical protein